MSNKTFLRNVTDLLNEHDMNRAELARRLGVSSGTISQWYSGLTFPNRKRQEAIAEILGVSVGSLFEEKKLIVPVYGEIKAGYPAFACEEILDYEEVTNDVALKGDCFGLRVKGDSMLPIFSDGDTVICVHCADAEDGSFVVALIGEEATLKQIQHSSQGVMFMPLNNAYSPLWYSNDQIASLPVQILGKVVELRKRF